MSSNGAVGCPEDMQVEPAHESSLKHLDAVVADKPSTNINNIADISGKLLRCWIFWICLIIGGIQSFSCRYFVC